MNPELDRSETPTLAAVMQETVKGILKDTHTAMPGKITKYDRNKRLASVQPSLKRKYKDGRVINLPVIQNVPVMFQGNKNIKTHFDLEPGDTVLLIFSERSIDKWQVSGGEILPGDKRMHHLSDAIAVPGIYPNSEVKAPLGDEGSYTVENGTNLFEIKEGGQFLFKNDSSELVSLLVDLLTELIKVLTNDAAGKNLTAAGPLLKEPTYVAQIEASKIVLELLKTKFETFKG